MSKLPPQHSRKWNRQIRGLLDNEIQFSGLAFSIPGLISTKFKPIIAIASFSEFRLEYVLSFKALRRWHKHVILQVLQRPHSEIEPSDEAERVVHLAFIELVTGLLIAKETNGGVVVSEYKYESVAVD